MIAPRNQLLNRLNRAVGKQGLIPFLKRQVTVRFNNLFRARLYVWVWEPGMPLVEESAGIVINRVESADQLSAQDLAELIEGDDATFEARMNEEFAEGGVLWIAKLDGQTAGYQWSRNGRYVQHWHMELSASDTLIYSAVTFYEFRGRGVGPSLMGRICREEVPAGGIACADCMIWNTPSVRFIEKTGFRKFAERKPLVHHPD